MGASARLRPAACISIFSVGGNLGSAISPLLIAALLPWLGRNAALIMLPIALIVSGLLYAQAQPTPLTRRAQTTVTAQSGTLLRTALILLTAAAMTRAWFQVSLMTYLPVWIESEGGTVAQASRLLAVFAFAIGGGAMFGGIVSDRVGPWRVVSSAFY